jgi:hypothetical protein
MRRHKDVSAPSLRVLPRLQLPNAIRRHEGVCCCHGRAAEWAPGQVSTVWVNDWVMMQDGFEEGGYKQSGRGRLRGLAALDDFLEYKHIVLQPGVIAPER